MRFKMAHFNIKKMQNPELVNLKCKCVTYAQYIPLPVSSGSYTWSGTEPYGRNGRHPQNSETPEI